MKLRIMQYSYQQVCDVMYSIYKSVTQVGWSKLHLHNQTNSMHVHLTMYILVPRSPPAPFSWPHRWSLNHLAMEKWEKAWYNSYVIKLRGGLARSWRNVDLHGFSNSDSVLQAKDSGFLVGFYSAVVDQWRCQVWILLLYCFCRYVATIACWYQALCMPHALWVFKGKFMPYHCSWSVVLSSVS